MKRLFTLSLLFYMILSFGTHTVAATDNEEKVLLSSLNDAQCRAFLLEQGVSILEVLNEIDLPGLFARLEENPDAYLTINWPVLADFVESVSVAVKSYYGYTTAPPPTL